MTDNSTKTILHLCADMGTDSKPYRDAGYNVICVGSDIGVENYQPPKNVYGIIANPPCTHFSIARSRAATPRDLREGMRLVKECLRIIWDCQYDIEEGKRSTQLKFWAIENPATGMLKNFLGNPTYQYCPSEFGADFTKRTALWGRFKPPPKPFFLMNPLRNRSLAGNVCNLLTHGRDFKSIMNERSKCYEQFALAFFEANQ